MTENKALFDLATFEELIVKWTEDASFYRSRALTNFRQLEELLSSDMLDGDKEIIADQLC